MQAHRLLPFVFIAVFVLAGLPWPMAQAQDASDWAVTVLPSNGQVPTEISMDNLGEKIGLAFRGSADSNVHFLLREDESSTWAYKTFDVSSGDNIDQLQLRQAGAGQWLLCGEVGATPAAGVSCFRSTDDGATWTKGTNQPCTGTNGILDDFRVVGNNVRLVCHNSPGPARYRTSSDLGDTWSAATVVSDNQGDPTDAATSTLNEDYAAIWPWTGETAATVDFITVTTEFDPYSVGTDDGTFWSVPFTTEGGTTRFNVNDQYCGDANYSRVTVEGDFNLQTARVISAAPTTVCAGGDLLPAGSGLTVSNGKTQYTDSNSDGQALVAVADLTENENRVYYRAGGGAWAESYSNAADTQAYAVEMTPTLGYFAYSNNAVGGRLEVAIASVFAVPTVELGFASEPIFCSEIGNQNFGYNYAEDISKTIDSPTSSLLGIQFKGDADNFAYAGKMIEPTTTAKVYFRIEADNEGRDSVFRAVFSFVDHTQYDTDDGDPTEGLPHLLTEDAKGNGKTTGVFAKALEVRFWEVGNDWNMRVFKMEGGSRVELGTAYIGDSPNTPTSYSFEVDTRNGGHYAVKRADNSTISNGPLERDFSSSLAAFVDDEIEGQWFVGYAADNFVNADAFTQLEDKDATASTCIYGLADAEGNPPAAIGDQGASGPPLNTTTGIPETIEDPGAPDEGPPGGGANSLFEPFVAAFGLMLGSQIAGQLATTVIVMFACAAMLGGRFGAFGMIIGCAVGLAMAIAGLVLPTEYALTTVILLAIGTVLAFMYGGRLAGGQSG